MEYCTYVQLFKFIKLVFYIEYRTGSATSGAYLCWFWLWVYFSSWVNIRHCRAAAAVDAVNARGEYNLTLYQGFMWVIRT